VPLLVYLIGPELQQLIPGGADAGWDAMVTSVWRFIVRPIAVGGMLVGTAYTLFMRRQSIFGGLARAFTEFSAPPVGDSKVGRTERYMSSKTVFSLIGVIFIFMAMLYVWMSKLLIGGVTAALVMLVAGFFFATVSGYLVGLIGSSNNPISGLTLSTLIVAALL